MMTEEHYDRIRSVIERSGIGNNALKEDLYDHFCCSVEAAMKRGLPFNEAYGLAYKQISPNGLKEIEHETIFLLNSKKILAMKKFIYSIGLVTSISISLGYLFILLHWPGGVEMFNFGFMGFLLLFIPLLVFDRYKNSIRKNLTERLRLLLGVCSALIAGGATVFKFLHLSGADILLLIGFLVFTFGFLPFQFFKLYKGSLE